MSINKNIAVFMAALLISCGTAYADSLFTPQAAEAGSLISDKNTSFRVGDIITVLVRETIDGSTQANTNTKKESDVGSEAAAADNPFLTAETPGGLNIIPEEQLPNWQIEMENEHKAAGKTDRKNKLIMTIACTITEVWPNGNLLIEGHKKVKVNREDNKLMVSGIIRAQDVTTANTVQSNQIADAVIELEGQGPLWNTQRRGVITKILDWFSPF